MHESKTARAASARLGELELLEANLRSRLSGSVDGIRIVLRGEGVALKGTARTFLGKELAQLVLRHLTDLPVVANEISEL